MAISHQDLVVSNRLSESGFLGLETFLDCQSFFIESLEYFLKLPTSPLIKFSLRLHLISAFKRRIVMNKSDLPIDIFFSKKLLTFTYTLRYS